MKFIISASEEVFYEVEVTASSLDEVKQMIDGGIIKWGEPIDGQNFEVVSIEEATI